MGKQKINNQSSGYIPPFGFITGGELAKRLGLTDLRNTSKKLQGFGIQPAMIAGKEVFRCEDLGKMFDSPNSNAQIPLLDCQVIPPGGLIAADELVRRLDVSPELAQAEIRQLNIPSVWFFGKRLFRCSDIAGLFDET